MWEEQALRGKRPAVGAGGPALVRPGCCATGLVAGLFGSNYVAYSWAWPGFATIGLKAVNVGLGLGFTLRLNRP